MEDEADVSIAYSLTEEEIHKELKEVKVGPCADFEIPLLVTHKKSTLINSENLQRHENAFGDIFSPPPEQV